MRQPEQTCLRRRLCSCREQKLQRGLKQREEMLNLQARLPDLRARCRTGPTPCIDTTQGARLHLVDTMFSVTEQAKSRSRHQFPHRLQHRQTRQRRGAASSNSWQERRWKIHPISQTASASIRVKLLSRLDGVLDRRVTSSNGEVLAKVSHFRARCRNSHHHPVRRLLYQRSRREENCDNCATMPSPSAPSLRRIYYQ